MKLRIFITIITFQFAALSLAAQTTEFSYQGSLKDGANVANGNYDFEFRLFDAASGGSQLGILGRNGVVVSNGIFSVSLDFGSPFTGADRYLEIGVRLTGGGGLTTLSPRQRVASSPYSIKSISAETSITANTANTATNAVNATNATTAVNLSGPLEGDVTGTQTATTVARLQGRNVASTAPTGGQVLKYNSGTSQWQPDTDLTGSGGGGTITGVTAGTGLTGGGTTGTVTVGIANSGVGTTQLADGSVTDPKITSVSGGKVTGAVTNSLQLGGVAANQFVQTTDSRLTDSRTPTAGSASYIQNGTLAQSASNFYISGNGLAAGTLSSNIVNAATQYNIAGSRLISNDVSKGNLFVGYAAGNSNPTGTGNVFIGQYTGSVTTSGNNNTFIGKFAGHDTLDGSDNSFVGTSAGYSNNGGSNNTYFGSLAGFTTTTNANNSFFGSHAGENLQTGSSNSFFGAEAGNNSTNGVFNAFFGYRSGLGTSGGSNAFFGSSSGQANGAGSSNAFFGQASGFANQTGGANAFFGYAAGDTNTAGGNNTIIGANADVASGNLTYATAIGSGAVVGSSDTIYMGRSGGADTIRIPGAMVLGTLGAAGATALCRNASNFIATCSSSLRYKTNLAPYRNGLSIINQLRPITFDWKDGGMHDLGFGAEDVAKIDSLLVTYNAKGEVEGVKYDRISAALVNAVKQQQTQIAEQQKKIIALKRLVCVSNRKAGICKER